MNTLAKYVAATCIALFVQVINGQTTNNQEEIKRLELQREHIEKQEREHLKLEVETINKRLDNKEITLDEADGLKKEAAQKRALNIENRIAIIENKIALLQRNFEGYKEQTGQESKIEISPIRVGADLVEDNKPKKYDLRTTNHMVTAVGLNNVVSDKWSLNSSPYSIGSSRFFELGWVAKTRVFKNTNAMRVLYGMSFQFNGLKPNDNNYFLKQGDKTVLETFQHRLKKSKLRTTHLVFPVHFEFGPSKKIEKEDYFRYKTDKQFKIGIGGYGGFNLGTRQKLKYEIDGVMKKDKIRSNYNTGSFVYGLSGYLAWGSIGLYAKYDISPLFRNQSVNQNNISLGLRFNLD